MPKTIIDIFVISISHNLLVGIYDKNSKLIQEFSYDGKTTDLLPQIFEKFLQQYKIDEIFYVNGPGSYMAIKVSYIFLKTLSIVYNIPLKASDGFAFNKNTPIKALGKKYFFKDSKGKIYVDFLEDKKIEPFKLPQVLDKSLFSDDNLPSYNLPAIN